MMSATALGAKFEKQVAEELQRLGFEVWRDLYAPTPWGHSQIDIVALKPGQVWVVECKNWGGLLDVETWTVTQNNNRRKVGDFMAQNHTHCEVVSAALDVPCYSRVVVNDSLRFREGVPPVCCIPLKNLEYEVSTCKIQLPFTEATIMRAHRVFDSWSNVDAETKKQHRVRLQDKYNPPEVVPL